MKTLKITLVAALTFLSAQSFGQTFGFAAGANFSNLHFNSTDSDEDYYDGYKTLIGFNAGGFYDFNFSDKMGLRLGLKYTSKGSHNKYSSTETYSDGFDTYTFTMNTDFKTTLNYVQVNPMFTYRLPVGENHLYAMVGPYLSVGLYGTQKGSQSFSYSDGTDTYSESDIIDEQLKFGEENDGLDHIDFGFTPAIGFELGNVFMEATYDFGINNIDTANDPDFKVYNRNISVSVGYTFGK